MKNIIYVILIIIGLMLFIILCQPKQKHDEDYTDLTTTKRIYVLPQGTFVQDQPAFVM